MARSLSLLLLAVAVGGGIGLAVEGESFGGTRPAPRARAAQARAGRHKAPHAAPHVTPRAKPHSATVRAPTVRHPASPGPAPRSPEPAPLLGAAEPRETERPDDPREQRIAQLRARLQQVLHDRPLSRTRVGVTVMGVEDGDVLFAYNADKLFNPASNTKILTTAAALSQLGADYHYRTTLQGPEPDDDGRVAGDVELRGSGDPSLGTAGIADLARAVAARGVTRIEGDILADGRYRDPAHPEAALGSGALIFNRNVYTVRVRPTEPKQSAVVSVDPAELFSIDAKVTTVAGKRTRLSIDLERRDGRLMIVARGRVNPRAEATVRRRLADGSLFAAVTLRRALADFGVEVTGGVRAGGLSGDAPTLAEHLSAPLKDICRISNKDSNNFVAEAIFKTLARERFGAPATPAKGSRAVGDLLAEVGIGPGSYRIVNGSGLTHENRIRPSGLALLLRHLYLDLSIAPEFLTSLAIGGIDGTIRNRFTSPDALGHVRAKTGTLSGVSALSGYAGEGGGVLIFSILVENFSHRRLGEVRQAQVRLVREMLAFLRAERPALPHPGTIVEPVEGDAPADNDADVVDDEPGVGGGGGN